MVLSYQGSEVRSQVQSLAMVRGSLDLEANMLPDGLPLDFFDLAPMAEQDRASKEFSRKRNKQRDSILWGSEGLQIQFSIS